ncbi:VOC family protein [Rubrobacter tropicus]|uniref:VOC family protein n=1 Tax=Rubrobacter tropicus TaxID=2653851 RepID=UPI00140D9197|nr:VOC family protein [Rubrobacter tropicus]
MLTRLDHLVILVQDLDRATEDYERLGFRVIPGGEHADGLTRNALVPFGDGTYLELVAFIDPEDDQDNVWGWREFLPHEGLIDYCAASDGLPEDVRRLRDLGFEVDGPHEGGRRLPDGRKILWRSASFAQGERVLPFMIEDLTPRETRVPTGPDTSHPNGATGIRRLEIAASDAQEATKNLAALAAVEPEHLKLGACELFPVDMCTEQGPGPVAVELSTAPSENIGALDRSLAHGVRFTLSPEADS